MSEDYNIDPRRYPERSAAVFEELFRTHSPSLVRFAETYVHDRELAQDVVQNLFTHVWENFDTITITSSVKSYLFQATRNRCLNRIRNLKVQDYHEVLYMEALVSSHEQSESKLDEDLVKQVNEILAQLPEKMAKVFTLKYLKGKKVMEIADALKVSENTVKTQLKRARFKIKELLPCLITSLLALFQ